jgi:outer membrane immunogenic protein
MKLVSGFLGMTLASAVAIVSANAADMYRAPEGVSYKDAPIETLWQGSYVGINGGYAWGGSSDVTAVGSTIPNIQALIISKGSFSTEGWFGGAQIGHNWQRDHLVFGIEADIEGANISGSKTVGAATAENNLDWFGTVRGRVGYAVGAALLYGTGGFAYGGAQDKLTAGGTTVTNDKVATGYAAGGGVEYAFNPAWSGKAEYQYINLGSDSLTNGGATADFNHEYNTVRLGLNYHVHGGYEPLK